MNNLDKLVKSIETRKPISFEYNKNGKTSGERIGNVHAIYIYTSKAGKMSTKVHLIQTDGVTDSGDRNPLPSFRNFNIEDISNITIFEDQPKFKIDSEKYNPEWEGYANVIAKV